MTKREHPPDPVAVVEVRWEPFVISEDGLLKQATWKEYDYREPLFDRSFASLDEFVAWLKEQPAQEWADRYVGEWTLLPIVRRRVEIKP